MGFKSAFKGLKMSKPEADPSVCVWYWWQTTVYTLFGAGHNRKAEKNPNRGINGVNAEWRSSAGRSEDTPSTPPRHPYTLNVNSLLLELIAACLAQHQLRKWIRSVFSAALLFSCCWPHWHIVVRESLDTGPSINITFVCFQTPTCCTIYLQIKHTLKYVRLVH